MFDQAHIAILLIEMKRGVNVAMKAVRLPGTGECDWILNGGVER